MRVAAFLVAMVLGSGCARAFDCTGVKLPSSIVICSDPELIRLADQRQQVFNEVRWGIDPQRDKELLADQTGWVRSYATACSVPPNAPPPDPVPTAVKECFKRAAEARIAYIRAYGATGASAIVQPAQAAAQTTPTAPASTVSPGYRAALSAWLESHNRYPESARQRGEEGRAMLRFRVARSGRVLNYAVVRSTGFPDLDAAVETMMRGARLPPFPADMTVSDVEVSVTIGFDLAGTAPPAAPPVEAAASPPAPLRPGMVVPPPPPAYGGAAPAAQPPGAYPGERAPGNAGPEWDRLHPAEAQRRREDIAAKEMQLNQLDRRNLAVKCSPGYTGAKTPHDQLLCDLSLAVDSENAALKAAQKFPETIQARINRALLQFEIDNQAALARFQHRMACQEGSADPGSLC
jgi:TonB family protein